MADLEAEKERKRKEDADKVRQTAKPLDKSRPISSTPISGTPWCVVWTGDSRVFFYNPSTRTSVWEKPEDLVGKSRYLENLNEYYWQFISFSGRADVDKAVSTIPEQLRILGVTDIVSEQVSALVVDSGKKDDNSEKNMEDADVNNASEEEVPAKKAKIEGKKSRMVVICFHCHSVSRRN